MLKPEDFIVQPGTSTTFQFQPTRWFTLGGCDIRISLQTGEVEIPEGLALTDASKAIWDGIKSLTQKPSLERDAIVLAIDALNRAEKQFTFYAEEHHRKGSEEKAATNYGFATLCGAAFEHMKLVFPNEAGNA